MKTHEGTGHYRELRKENRILKALGIELTGLGGGIWEARSSGGLEPVCGYVKPFPIYPPEFKFPAEGKQKAQVKLLVSGKMFEVSAGEDSFIVPLERLDDFEVLVVE